MRHSTETHQERSCLRSLRRSHRRWSTFLLSFSRSSLKRSERMRRKDFKARAKCWRSSSICVTNWNWLPSWSNPQPEIRGHAGSHRRRPRHLQCWQSPWPWCSPFTCCETHRQIQSPKRALRFFHSKISATTRQTPISWMACRMKS